MAVNNVSPSVSTTTNESRQPRPQAVEGQEARRTEASRAAEQAVSARQEEQRVKESAAPAPVLNIEGQTTGQVVNTSA